MPYLLAARHNCQAVNAAMSEGIGHTQSRAGDQAVNKCFILSIRQNQNPPLTVLGTGSYGTLLKYCISLSKGFLVL